MQVVKQPDGKYAIFSHVTDDFLMSNLSEKEVGLYLLADRLAYALKAAEDEHEEAVKKANESNGDDWQEILGIIEANHGDEAVRLPEIETVGSHEETVNDLLAIAQAILARLQN